MKGPDLRKREYNDSPERLNRAEISQEAHKSRRNVLEIMKNDFKSAFTNPIVTLLLIGVIILPSLYGLVNIYACWDPYENTDHVQFAIANEDDGATYQEYTINAGNDLVESLKNNTDFQWVFVSSDDLRRGVHNGTYYAGMIIPHNFSQSIVSITTDDPHSAELEYIVNQKYPVAAKLTDSAAKAVYNKLNAEIVSFIDVAAYGKLGELQEGLQSGADEMSEGADLLAAGADEVDSGAAQLVSGANQVSGGADQLSSGANQLSTGASELSSGAMAVSTGATEVARGASDLSSGADQVASGASQVADGTHQISNNVNDFSAVLHKIIQSLENGGNSTKLADDVDELNNQAAHVSQRLNELDNETREVSNDAADLSQEVNNMSVNASRVATGADRVANKTHDVATRFNNVSSDISRVSELIKTEQNQSRILELLKTIDHNVSQLNQSFTYLDSGAHQVANGSQAVSTGANSLANGTLQLADGASQLSTGASQLSSGADELADGADTLASGVHVLSNGTIELAAGASLLGNSAADALFTASDSLYSSSDQLGDITGLTEDQVGDYFFAPVKLVRHEEFPSNNYGSQVTPFYIVLSMWVGALVTTVMLKTGTSMGTKYKPHEMYMGKLALFNIMAILQTTVTLIGVFLLGVDIYNPLMFIFSCYFVSLVFMTLIYSLTSLFGDVGKGVAILLLVFQISGSGGIYPVEIMNTFFGMIYSYLPMTHAINIVRESQLGLIWVNYWPSFLYLWFLGVIFIILSILLKQRWDKRTKFLEEKLEESNLFS